MADHTRPSSNPTPSASMEVDQPTINPFQTDLPFLVTHWLSNYRGTGEEGDETRQAALEKLHQATADIASAFSSLGAYGSSSVQPFGTHSPSLRNATFADQNRQWSSSLPSHHLENIANTIGTNALAAESIVATRYPQNLMLASREVRNGEAAGRTLHDAIDVETEQINTSTSSAENGRSLLHAPMLIQQPTTGRLPTADNNNNNNKLPSLSAATAPKLSLTITSTYGNVAKKTAEMMRQYLRYKEEESITAQEIRTLQMSQTKQQRNHDELTRELQNISVSEAVAGPQEIEDSSDATKQNLQECERVLFHLGRKIPDLVEAHANKKRSLLLAQKESKLWDEKRKEMIRGFQDPFQFVKESPAPGHRVGGGILLRSLLGRAQGQLWTGNRRVNGSMGYNARLVQQHIGFAKKSVLGSRLSHASTINTHLAYPVYCLRFDRTGRYFITGADDYLMKIFCIGSGRSCRNKNKDDGSRLLRCNYGANVRGAVLVCTLRGHAGVINDIDVSPDNCFLASASVDGDVRVWGLRDGCPVAILRGHKGGANMVVWSKLSPFRLVTTGADGYTRSWDIREACLKRYGAMVGKRKEYQLPLNEVQEGATSRVPAVTGGLSPLPSEQTTSQAPVEDSQQNSTSNIVVPPLPPAVPPLPGAPILGTTNGLPSHNVPGNENVASGQFVANANIDEGVTLLKKHRHGENLEDAASGPGTRSRRKPVNVICVSRSPLGGQFATGSDDGFCRVWDDPEAALVARADARNTHSVFRHTLEDRPHQQLGEGDKPMAVLGGYGNSVTDLAYSHRGDRLLSASQMDGVVRLWSLTHKVASTTPSDKADKSYASQIVLKLADVSMQPNDRTTEGPQNRTARKKISCDVTVWTHDDRHIVTSQCILIKQSGSEIEPGSQQIFLWESYTGKCLLGISSAHAMQCPILVPHPSDENLICSASADGTAKLWDLQTGKCVLEHENKSESTEPARSGKLSGYLDGSFSPDGTTLVLTDDNGSITILDSVDNRTDVLPSTTPTWTSEQYFANDYYDLFYDENGYCIERGSERPPHLAPRGVRCNHTGSPYDDKINETYRRISGPLPLPSMPCVWQRELLRDRFHCFHNSTLEKNPLEPSTKNGRMTVREVDKDSTIIVQAGADTVDDIPSKRRRNGDGRGTQATSTQRRTNSSGNPLSSNYDYLDYDDMIRAQGNDEADFDSDDEDFELNNGRNQVNDTISDSEDDLRDSELGSDDETRPSTRRSNAHNAPRRQRAQRRAQRRHRQFQEIESDDEMISQFVSTNRTPSGPYERDFSNAGHIWRMQSGNLRRRWLSRDESDSSFEGRKTYCPQVGEQVVYIPMAHLETIEELPSVVAPWQKWPQDTSWPAVRCLVRGIRHRFPCADYYHAQPNLHNSVVAILSLEITGIPETPEDRRFPWPAPGFRPAPTQCLFELCLAANDHADFLFPETMYLSRLKSLESALEEQEHPVVSIFYNEQTEGEDSEMKRYSGVVDKLLEGSAHSDPHLVGSGFGLIALSMDEFTESCSPWELLHETTSFDRPKLTDDDKKLVLEKLSTQTRDGSVAEFFNMPVDQERYCDYSKMVPVEICLMFMKRRLESNFYSSKLSVVSDLRMLRDNCAKYNSFGDLSALAARICEDFENNILSEEEKRVFVTEEEYDRLTAATAASRQTYAQRYGIQSANASQGANSGSARLRARETRRDSESLSRLSAPAPPPPRRSSRRTAHGTEPEPSEARMRQPLGRRSENLESLGLLSNRPRRARNNGNLQQQSHRRASSRPRNNSVSYADVEDSEPESAEPQLERALHTTRSGRRANRLVQRETFQPPQQERATHDFENEDEFENSGPNRRSRRERSSRRSADDEVESDHDIQPIAPRNMQNSNARTSNSATRPTRSTRAQNTSNATSRATRRQESSSDESKASSSAESDAEPESEEDSSEPELNPRSSRPASKRSRSNRATYAELPSDYEESDDDDMSAASERIVQKGRGRSSKRARIESSSDEVQSPPKRGKSNGPAIPELKDWPEIEIADITKVSTAIVEEMSKRDTHGLFATPVLEAHPGLAKDYLRVVLYPMDLRTIEEERIQCYEHIGELQKDLVLIFRNCCSFNEEGSDFWEVSRALWCDVNDVFQSVCQRMNVMLPRRWTP